MKTDKKVLNQWDGFSIIRQIGRMSLSFFPAHNFIMTCKRTRCACGLSAAAARSFSIATNLTLWERGCLQRVYPRLPHSTLPAP